MDNQIEILDLKFKPYISEVEIEKAIKAMSGSINERYSQRKPLFICVLNGSFIFSSDLLKNISIPCQIEFVKLKSYDGMESTRKVKEMLSLQSDIKDRDIIILEDIVDTGHTLNFFIEKISALQPNSIAIAALLFKKRAFQYDFKIDYLGIEIEDKFVVGYGMDYKEYGRNLSSIYQLA